MSEQEGTQPFQGLEGKQVRLEVREAEAWSEGDEAGGGSQVPQGMIKSSGSYPNLTPKENH